MDKEIRVKVNNEIDLVVSVGHDQSSEISVFIENHKSEIVWQDIALVRPSKSGEFVEALVWANENDEDYTHKFAIKLYQNEEEDSDVQ